MAVEISSSELQALLQSNELYALIDVRERTEYNLGQILTATNVPRRELEFRMPRLVPLRSTKIVLYDDDGKRASLAAHTLEENGYTRVEVLKSGLNAWRTARNKLVEGVNVPSKIYGEIVACRYKPIEIVPAELKARLDRGEEFIIIEVRPPEEVRHSGSIPGAINIQGVQLPLIIHDIVKQGKKIVITCAGRTRGIVSAQTLKMMGIDVLDLKNGTQGWFLAGYELEKGIPEGQEPSAESRQEAIKFAVHLMETNNLNRISQEEIDNLKHNNTMLYLFDVRTPEEYAAGHIPGSVSLPGGQAIQCADDYVSVRNGTIVFVCDDMIRSVITAYWYREMGFKHVYIFSGGINQALKSGVKLEIGQDVMDPMGFQEAKKKTIEINTIQLNRLLEKHTKVNLIYVGDGRHFRSGHIPGSLWVSRSIIEPMIESVAPEKEKTMILTCSDGLNSVLASATLIDLGYKDVKVLAGGTSAWKRDGFALEGGSTGIVVEFDDILPRSHERSIEQMIKYLNWEEKLHGGALDLDAGAILNSI